MSYFNRDAPSRFTAREMCEVSANEHQISEMSERAIKTYRAHLQGELETTSLYKDVQAYNEIHSVGFTPAVRFRVVNGYLGFDTVAEVVVTMYELDNNVCFTSSDIRTVVRALHKIFC